MLAGSLRADVLIGNLPKASDDIYALIGGTDVAVGLSPPHLARRALRFTMPSTAYTLDNVVLRLGGADVDGPPLISIRADDAGSGPGSLMATLNNSTLTPDLGDYAFTSPESVALAANTSYWVLLDYSLIDLGSGLFQIPTYSWWGTIGGNQPTGAATWNGSAIRFGDGAWILGGSSYTFEINATPVPEPATLGLALLAVGGLVGVRRR